MAPTIAVLLLTVALAACGDDSGGGQPDRATDPGVTAELRDSTRSTGHKVEWTVGPRTVFSKDGSASMRIPAGPRGWQVLDDVAPVLRGLNDSNSGDSTLLTAGSEPPGARPIAGCRPPFIRRKMPTAGGLVQILEISISPKDEQIERDSYGPRPARFQVGKRRNEQCGMTEAFAFRMWNRAFMAWIWVGPGRHSAHPRRPDPETRRQVSRVLNSFQAQRPGAAPIRPPFMALDCRNPPSTLGCDRVYFHLATRVPMSRVAVRLGGSQGRTFDLEPNRRPGGAASASPRTTWTGYMPEAGLTERGSPLEVKLGPSQARWTGLPRVRATVEVIARRPEGPTFTQAFPETELVAGHG